MSGSHQPRASAHAGPVLGTDEDGRLSYALRALAVVLFNIAKTATTHDTPSCDGSHTKFTDGRRESKDGQV
jgi:hypothetical protein